TNSSHPIDKSLSTLPQGSPISRANSIGMPATESGRTIVPVPVTCTIPPAHHSQQQQQQPEIAGTCNSRSRFQHIRPPATNHRKLIPVHQVFAEQRVSQGRERLVMRLRFTHSCANCGHQQAAAACSGGFRPGRFPTATSSVRPAAQPADGEVLASCATSLVRRAASPAPSLALSSCMRPLSRVTASSSGELAVPAAPTDEGSYVHDAAPARPHGVAFVQNSYQQQRELDESTRA
uniref:Uncharacterized protein n=1 Tax=Macrostomum lignano TaxID=282301 RepID=A0A1I8F8G6_9PLAT